MQDLADQGVCVFCHVDDRVLRRSQHWLVVRNDFPYAGASDHLLLIPTAHVTSIFDLSSEAQTDLWDLIFDIVAELPHFSLFARFGDSTYTGASVVHVHVHVISAASTEGVRVRLG